MKVLQYLTVPRFYDSGPHRLWWTKNFEALEYATDEPQVGLTFAMAGELALFLEGLVGADKFPHFEHVLHLLQLFGFGDCAGRPAQPFGEGFRDASLAATFRAASRPLRNAGALCAWLCRDVPDHPDPPELAEVLFRLNVPGWTQPTPDRAAEAVGPPLDLETFEARVLDRLRRLDAEEVRHWLRHGRGSVREAGETVARQSPRTLGEVLSEVEDAPRLRGAAALASRLAGALSLPPRRLAAARLPMGGYADVSTRGQPEQILPAQFALDDDEFLRRFAERELLYFHREEPKTPVTRELALVIDQGVRTWGTVRLVLSAAALALARQAARRGLALRIAATGRDGPPLDAASAGPAALTALLDASDLSPQPAETLVQTFEAAPEDRPPRDLVLLTHPRNLAEPAVRAAARVADADTRLFAVTVDGRGEVVLSQVRCGEPVALARCRVDLNTLPGDDEPTADAASSRPDALGWTGRVEAVGFPFPVGPLNPIRDHLITFDASGEWLLLAERDGLLHLWRADGTVVEMLPRAARGAATLTDVEGVVGVTGGFLVAGSLAGAPHAAVYSLRRRSCRLMPLAAAPARGWSWSYLKRWQVVVAFSGESIALTIDLNDSPDADECRLVRAVEEARANRSDQIIRVGTSDFRDRSIEPSRTIAYAATNGIVAVRDDQGVWSRLVPRPDGVPELRGGSLLKARWHGDVVAMLVVTPYGDRRIKLFSLGGGARALGDRQVANDVVDFALSPDGRRVAWRTGVRSIEVGAVGDSAPPLMVAGRGRVHPDLRVALGATFLTVETGRNAILIRWDSAALEVEHGEGDAGRLVRRVYGETRPATSLMESGVRPPAFEDRARFFATGKLDRLTAGVDRYSQLTVLDQSGKLVCMFFVFRRQVAGWMPDGTRFGPPSLLGGAATPGAETRFAATLQAASSGAGEAAP
jgi:hypothetical protein